MIKFEKERDEITLRLMGTLNRVRSLRPFLNKNVVEQFRNVQKKRWLTENTSEGQKWQELSPFYAARKRKDYAKSNHGGNQILYASGDLFKAVIGPGKGFKKLVTDRKLILGIDSSIIPYGQIHDEGGRIKAARANISIPKRPFTLYSKATMREFYDMIFEYVVKNKIKPNTNA